MTMVVAMHARDIYFIVNDPLKLNNAVNTYLICLNIVLSYSLALNSQEY